MILAVLGPRCEDALADDVSPLRHAAIVVERYACAVPDKEHPAAKAGRYVRAAGIVIGKEIDRRAQAAATKPAPAAPPPPPPPPPAPRTHNIGGKTLFGLFVLSFVILGLLFLHADDSLPKGTRTIGHLVIAGLMFLEAALLISNWRQSNERIGQRLLNRCGAGAAR